MAVQLVSLVAGQVHVYMLHTKFEFRPSEDITAQSVDQCFAQQSGDCAYNPRIYNSSFISAHLHYIWLQQLDHVAQQLVGTRLIQTLKSRMPCQTVNFMEAARSSDLTTCGYVCSGPAVWTLGSFWSRSWPLKQGDCQLLDILARGWIASQGNTSNPHFVQGKVLRIALIPALYNEIFVWSESKLCT